jgi:hypothetical protein
MAKQQWSDPAAPRFSFGLKAPEQAGDRSDGVRSIETAGQAPVRASTQSEGKTVMEYGSLARRLNEAWARFERTRETTDIVRAMHEAAMRWGEICAARCDRTFIEHLTFIDWDEERRKPQDKWARLRTWATQPVVLKYADKQAWRGWSVWREVSKMIKAKGPDFVEGKFASGEWGPDLRRETMDKKAGNKPRHKPRH